MDAEPPNHLYFSERCFNGLAEHDDPVGRKTSGEFAFLEYGYFAARSCKVCGTREARRAGADYRYSFAIRRSCLEEIDPAIVDVIRRVTLETADHDRLLFGVEYAGAFAEFLHRANACACRA